MGRRRKDLSDRDIAKDIAETKPESGKNQRYVHINKVKAFEDKGWKRAEPRKNKKGRTLGIKTDASGKTENAGDLVLMEK